MTRATEPVDTAAEFAVRLSANLPGGDANGLKHWARLLAQQPRERHYAVILFDTARVIDDVDNDTDTAVVRILRVEVAGDGLTKRAAALLEAAGKGRGTDPALFTDEPGDDEPADA
jgi:hypothetical protein